MKPPDGPPEPESCEDVKVVLAKLASTLTSPGLLVLGLQDERNDRAAPTTGESFPGRYYKPLGENMPSHNG